MRFLLDSNILRHLSGSQPNLERHLARVPASEIGIPFFVVIEQLRGRFDACLKAAPENLLREQTRLLETQAFLSNYQIVYATETSVTALKALRQKASTHKRYVDVLIASLALAENAVVVTRNVADFRDLLPADKIQNWIDEV